MDSSLVTNSTSVRILRKLVILYKLAVMGRKWKNILLRILVLTKSDVVA